MLERDVAVMDAMRIERDVAFQDMEAMRLERDAIALEARRLEVMKLERDAALKDMELMRMERDVTAVEALRLEREASVASGLAKTAAGLVNLNERADMLPYVNVNNFTSSPYEALIRQDLARYP